MIHQLIFARPKPGMTEQEFQDYWLHVHAVKYASKISQIRRYKVDTRIALSDDPPDPLFSGIAEIWLQNEQEQLESLQSPEFLQGARADEPNWAAFWATIALDTDTHCIFEDPKRIHDEGGIKLVTVFKRKPGMSLEAYRRYCIETQAPLLLGLPGLRRCLQCLVRDSFYSVGESRFDSVSQLWFDDVAAFREAMASTEYQRKVKPDLGNFVDPKYVFPILVKEHWIIGPDRRSEP